MVQSGEKILFASDGVSETVEAHILISYQGAAENFAWVVPVLSVPEIDVGINATFLALEVATPPAFVASRGGCDCYADCWRYCPGEGEAESEAEAEAEGEHGVRVVGQYDVGPYQAAVLSSGSALELVEWLDANDYRVDESMEAIIETYVAEGYYFVALRLRRDQTTGDIQPVVLRLQEGPPCIPLRLTAIAAVPDMPVRVWVLGPSRAVPLNYRHVRLNWAALNWPFFTDGRDGGEEGEGEGEGYVPFTGNYDNVMKRAVDAAGGRAFVTDGTFGADVMARQLWWDGRYDTDALRGIEEACAFIDALSFGGWPADGQMLAILQRHIPVPQTVLDKGYTPAQFYDGCDVLRAHFPQDFDFDPDALADELEAVIVDPLREAQELFDRLPRLTRLTTYISPEEMTADVFLGFNADLPEVDPVRRATATSFCGDTHAEDTVVYDLPDGGRVVLRGARWPDVHPAAAVEQLSERGPGLVVEDFGQTVEALPADLNPECPVFDASYCADVCASREGEGEAEDESGGGCACRAGGRATAGWAWAAAAAAAVATATARRRRHSGRGRAAGLRRADPP